MSTESLQTDLSHTIPLPPGAILARLDQYSFSDEAAMAVGRDCVDIQAQYHNDIGGVWKSVVEEGSYGVLPYENATGGVVWPHLDRLSSGDVQIVAEVRQQVNMCLGRIQNQQGPIHRVYSHPKAFEQSREFLESLGIVKCIPTESTVEGVRRVAEQCDGGGAALASRSAIMSHRNMYVVQQDVADKKAAQNVTQFYVVHENGTHELPDPEKKYHAAILTAENVTGGLNRVLSIIANARANLSSIHSRPISLKEYEFFVEMTREGKPEEFELMSKQLPHNMPNLKWLGSWDHRYESR